MKNGLHVFHTNESLRSQIRALTQSIWCQIFKIIRSHTTYGWKGGFFTQLIACTILNSFHEQYQATQVAATPPWHLEFLAHWARPRPKSGGPGRPRECRCAPAPGLRARGEATPANARSGRPPATFPDGGASPVPDSFPDPAAGTVRFVRYASPAPRMPFGGPANVLLSVSASSLRMPSAGSSLGAGFR
jgi:hypothetical protein